ncbi:MAG TPA: iron-containing redox enzyme family protein [Kofleriaceae bacterium]|nr:iron-containing redox enzyme family protein [Kofleriaceae bacterium]
MSHNLAANADLFQFQYESVDQMKLEALRRKHGWLVEPLERACDLVAKMPFFRWVRELRRPSELKCAAQQLYCYSAALPKAMGLMLGLTPTRESGMMPFYAKHAYGQADHHLLLRRWMRKQGLIAVDAELELVIPSLETNACTNLAYQLAIEQDRDKWLVAVHGAIARCASGFYKVVALKLHELDAGDECFDAQVDVDEHRSLRCLEHLRDVNPASHRARVLLSKALEGVSLWASMIHSWIGIRVSPAFALDGTLLANPRLV